MAERKLVRFDVTREDIPPLAGFDRTQDIPYAAAMANEDLRITCTDHPGRFREVYELAEAMYLKANPGKDIAIIDTEEDAEGHWIACTMTVKEPEAK